MAGKGSSPFFPSSSLPKQSELKRGLFSFPSVGQVWGGGSRPLLQPRSSRCGRFSLHPRAVCSHKFSPSLPFFSLFCVAAVRTLARHNLPLEYDFFLAPPFPFSPPPVSNFCASLPFFFSFVESALLRGADGRDGFLFFFFHFLFFFPPPAMPERWTDENQCGFFSLFFFFFFPFPFLARTGRIFSLRTVCAISDTSMIPPLFPPFSRSRLPLLTSIKSACYRLGYPPCIRFELGRFPFPPPPPPFS